MLNFYPGISEHQSREYSRFNNEIWTSFLKELYANSLLLNPVASLFFLAKAFSKVIYLLSFIPDPSPPALLTLMSSSWTPYCLPYLPYKGFHAQALI